MLRIGATFSFSVMVVFIKLLSDAIPTGQIVFFRSAFALIPLVLFLFMTHEFPSGLATKKPMGHILRCLLGCVAMFTSFTTIKYLPIADATIIGYLSPILGVILARFVLKEQVTAIRLIGVALGFSGMAVLILPDLTALNPDRTYLIGVGFGLITALVTACAVAQVRHLTKTESAGAIAFYFAMTCALAGLATWPLGWAQPSMEQLMFLIGSGIAGGFAHIMMTLGYKYSEISKLATFEYLSLAFAVIADLVIFSVVPSYNFYLSATLIIGATLLVAFKDRKKSPQVMAAQPSKA